MSLQEALESCLHQGISAVIFPGAAMAVCKDGEIITVATAGKATYLDWAPEITENSIFDLASLTKPLVTGLATAALYAKGIIGLDDPVSKYFQPSNPVWKNITIRHLLLHTSGLPAHRPFYKIVFSMPEEMRRSQVVKSILATPIQAPPEEKTLYSDLGFILLGSIIEKITSLRLDHAWKKLVQRPLALDELFFSPVPAQGLDLANVVPTEYCPFRKKIIWGEVNDLNCWALGGVAGHAGLFGTIKGVAKAIGKIFDIYKNDYEDSPIPAAAVRLFLEPVENKDRTFRALGFDVPSLKASQAGTYFTNGRSVGHLGFTGTSFWLDLEKGIAMVLLSNRTFPHHTEEKQKAMAQFRAHIHDVAWKKLSF